jgi:hypothetical protein
LALEVAVHQLLTDWENHRHVQAQWWIDSGWSEFVLFLMGVLFVIILWGFVSDTWQRWRGRR